MALKPADFFSIYKQVFDSWRLYWKTYGGFQALLRSPYFHTALVLSAVCWPIWNKQHEDWGWYNLSVSVIPNLLGFTLGGYAILLAFGDERFRKILAAPEEDPPKESSESSPFMAVNATFIHFIVVQLFSLIIAVIALGWELKTGIVAFFGFATFAYALTTCAAAALSVLRLAKWFDLFSRAGLNKKSD